ncbi:hypothetical protein TNCV_447121, partial [Trichonephila clavipes]
MRRSDWALLGLNERL